MKKALITGIAAALIATTAGAGAVIGTRGWTADDYASSPVVQTAVLKQGSKGGEVKEVQRRLKQWGYYTGSVDGIYGKGTIEAVKRFQKKNGGIAMKTIRIFTRRMALFIKSKGIEPIGTTQDENKPHLMNWIFEDSPEVRSAMAEYSSIFYVR